MSRSAAISSALLFATGCIGTAPPASQFPSASAALDRMHATYACSRGITGESKLDYLGDEGRIRASILFAAVRPESVRVDVYSSFGATLSTFTSDGANFGLSDTKEKKFYYGPARQCAVARFLGIPVPPQALVQLLAGEAPVLVHAASDAQISWQSGAYELKIRGQNQAIETISLLPSPGDWSKPWADQRVRVLGVQVEQQGIELYRAEFLDHQSVATAAPRVDPDGLEPPVPPSGPPCSAEVPQHIRFTVPSSGRDVELAHKELHHNPPLHVGMFSQSPSSALRSVAIECSE
ncbi:MAG TPA: hypothetical protein VL137_09585 [Polyangiaceae bacterium]|nr:hypothetical protein [Polyangiaceae bacterium]